MTLCTILCILQVVLTTGLDIRGIICIIETFCNCRLLHSQSLRICGNTAIPDVETPILAHFYMPEI